tara:strand:+ start:49825 stop:50847 length:1023 start_codon:yes stop_codon:yes gene_type:complete
MMAGNDNFYKLAKNSKKILVVDLGFLGDTVHLLPALWMIRQACPKARLEVIVSDHIKGLLALAPWIDEVHGYPRFPKGPKWYQDLGRVRQLRKSGYTAVINLNGSDRSTLLSRTTGAPLRLVRVPQRKKWYWKYLVTHSVEVPYETMPVYEQRCECLKRAGFPEIEPRFEISIPQEATQSIEERLGELEHFVHVSPFTTEDFRELPLDLMADLLNALGKQYSYVLSCAPNERECGKLEKLLLKLQVLPAKVFAGDLDLIELTALIKKSDLHLGGDSGALHLALMAGVPTFSWFKTFKGNANWMPVGERHRSVIGQISPEGLQGISLDTVRGALKELDFAI